MLQQMYTRDRVRDRIRVRERGRSRGRIRKRDENINLRWGY